MGQGQEHAGAADADDEFAAFVLASQRRLCRVAYLVCGDWHRAEDIVQTALAQVYVVVGALAALPARQRAVVVLRYIEDLDVEATAGLFGISTGTVKSQAAKGLTGLRVLLSAPAEPAVPGTTSRTGKGEVA